MNTAQDLTATADAAYAPAIEAACRAIAPNWPLDRQIAVNPYWGFVDQPFETLAQDLHRLVGARFALPASAYREAWASGEITAAALSRALAEHQVDATIDRAVASLQDSESVCNGLPLLSDHIDQQPLRAAGPLWRDTITQQISQYCASYFDEHQADWHRGKATGLFRGWRLGLQADQALETLMHAPEIRSRARKLPGDADAAIDWSLARLGLEPDEALQFLQLCLLRINGWASWCAFLNWEAGLKGGRDGQLRDLLAIRVSWEALLHDGARAPGTPGHSWQQRWNLERKAAPTPEMGWSRVWQRAHEISHQDRLVEQLQTGNTSPAASHRMAIQGVFCIDVRSERFRRALETLAGDIETRGFAGFFGLPLRFTPMGNGVPRHQLPGLLPPSLEVTESTGDATQDALMAARVAEEQGTKQGWQPFFRTPSGAFSQVETLGIGYAASILGRHLGASGSPRDKKALRPRLCLSEDTATDRKADLVASILRTMSLTSGFARLLVLVGHGSQSANNPQAAALDCGACGGHSGEVNARVLATLLNEPAVRQALISRGIDIPEDTIAIAALHNTTTDEVRLFDIDGLPRSHAPDLARLQRCLAEAGQLTRTERAPDLGLAKVAHKPDALLRQLRTRASDWAETRPEWGLADNFAFIVAPRSHTRGLDLAGRSFLHDYDPEADGDGAVLEQILTAPMVVTHWINLQYYASTVDPVRFGSGNKLLHNVACGRIGVFEGNTGDLRIGLARQSIHDGTRWMHRPLRLSVVIDAPRESIDRILARHATVRQLVDNQWLYLLRFGEHGIEWRRQGQWLPWDAAEPSR